MKKKPNSVGVWTESLLIAAQNNAIRNNHIKARIDKIANVHNAVIKMKPLIT